MNQLVLLIVAFAFIMVFINQSGVEGYSSVVGLNNESRNTMDDFYLWRAYGHDAYNHCRLNDYPYNYSPKQHPKRYTYYNPYFYKYGYGHL